MFFLRDIFGLQGCWSLSCGPPPQQKRRHQQQPCRVSIYPPPFLSVFFFALLSDFFGGAGKVAYSACARPGWLALGHRGVLYPSVDNERSRRRQVLRQRSRARRRCQDWGGGEGAQRRPVFGRGRRTSVSPCGWFRSKHRGAGAPFVLFCFFLFRLKKKWRDDFRRNSYRHLVSASSFDRPCLSSHILLA